ncbi:MAG: helix-turn-helix transcriptional regulator [Flavobacteriales bacterium]|nr:helix-turn-helix transcriptional regulator [Flavobacteriales bacterium]
MKTTGLTELKERHLGNIGTPKRDQYEQELRVEILAGQIKELRKERNLTQEELGKLIGVQRAQISKLENGMSNVTIGTVLKVFNALKAQINFSIIREDDLQTA